MMPASSTAGGAEALDAASPMRMTGPTRACPVCASRDADHLHHVRYALFDDSGLPSETAIVCCRSCGTVYTDSQATAADYRAHYAHHSKYDSAEAASGSGRTIGDAVRLAAQVERVADSLLSDAAILDVGAGQGGLLQAFARHGFVDITGIDPSPGCVATMRRHGLRAEVGDLEAVEWQTDPRRFDLIVLSHVLEHVFDVGTIFAQVDARVASGGRIYIEVPDATRYTLEGFPPHYFFDPEHINHFDLNALATLGKRFGWRVERSWRASIVLDSGVHYPIAAVMLVRADATGSSTTPYTTSANAVQEYLEASRRASSSPCRFAVSWASTRRPLVVWGAGSHAQRLLAQSALGDCAIDCIIDRDVGKQGRWLGGFAVVDVARGLARAVALDAEIAVAVAVGADGVVARLAVTHPALVVRVL